jgi:N-acylneuraminate cytidylyltransferase
VSVLAVIPARGGSKQVPRKNLVPIAGVPLVGRAIATARATQGIDHVVVSTDDAEIARVAGEHGALVIDRPASMSGDTASSELALLHALDQFPETDTLVFLQATSPFIDPVALGRAIDRVSSGADDVVFSAFETYAFLWRQTSTGTVGVNHESAVRPRRQDREAHLHETGAFYVMNAAGFREAGHRFFGRIGVELTEERAAIEIDTPDQLQLAQAIAGMVQTDCDIDVDAVVTDFDGVHTDDTAQIDAKGGERVVVNRGDGLGIRLLSEAGIPVLILSTEEHPVVAARAAKLRIEAKHGVANKEAALAEWASARGIALDRIAYVGNDINDLGALSIVGWPIAVPGSHPSVLSAARVVLGRRGGSGAVRELAERVLRARTREQING